MSKLTDYYRTLGIHNAHEFAGRGNVYIDYYPYDPITGGMEYVVLRPGVFNYGKVFLLCRHEGSFSERRRLALKDAQEWASHKFGIAKWKRTPFDSWMDEDFVNRRMRELVKK